VGLLASSSSSSSSSGSGSGSDSDSDSNECCVMLQTANDSRVVSSTWLVTTRRDVHASKTSEYNDASQVPTTTQVAGSTPTSSHLVVILVAFNSSTNIDRR